MWTEKLNNGKVRYVERYIDYISGKSKRVSIVLEKDNRKSRKLAEDVLRQKIEEKQTKNQEADITLADLTKKYLSHQKSKVRPSTYRRDTFAHEAIISLLGGDSIADRLTAAYIKESFDKAKNKSLSWKNEQRKHLLAMLRWGYEYDYLTDISYIQKIKKYEDNEPDKKLETKFLSEEELEKLLISMKASPCENWYLMTKLLVETGMRIGEAIALDKKDVDLEQRYITISKTYNTVDRLLQDSAKTKESNREIYIQDELLKTIKEINLYTKKEQLYQGYGSTRIFFPDSKGTYIHYDAYRIFLRRQSEKVLGRVLTPHALRHTHVSLLASQGVDFETIARRVGHASTGLTKDIYFHVTDRLKERDNETIKKIKLV